MGFRRIGHAQTHSILGVLVVHLDMATMKSTKAVAAADEPKPNRIERIDRLIFWALIAMVAAGRLAIALANYRSLITLDILQDDAFYYFKIAGNLASGRGLTFDGHTATTGFHPLFLLLLTPIAWLTQPDLIAP